MAKRPTSEMSAGNGRGTLPNLEKVCGTHPRAQTVQSRTHAANARDSTWAPWTGKGIHGSWTDPGCTKVETWIDDRGTRGGAPTCSKCSKQGPCGHGEKAQSRPE